MNEEQARQFQDKYRYVGWFECLGCDEKRPYSLVVQYHGQEHTGCKQTNGCKGYWVAIPPEPMPESPISAMEQDYIDSWEDYL